MVEAILLMDYPAELTNNLNKNTASLLCTVASIGSHGSIGKFIYVDRVYIWDERQ